MSLIPTGDASDNTGPDVSSIFSKLTPLQMRIASALVYTKDIDEALAVLEIDRAVYDALADHERQAVTDAASAATLDIVTASQTVLLQAALSAAHTMVELTESEDEEMQYKSARYILENTHGKPRARQEITQRTINVKAYAVREASPAIWDDDDDDVIEAQVDESD